MMSTKFLKDKLGSEKYDNIKKLYSWESFDQKALDSLLGKDSHFKKICDYTFKNTTPST